MEHQAKPSFKQADWDVYAECYDALLSLLPYQELLRTVTTTLAQSSDDKVLDAGCGTGNLLLALHHINARTSLMGIDLSESMLRRAKAKCRTDHTRFVQTDLGSTLPFDARTFSKIVSVNVLYALKDPHFTLLELERVLAQRGTLVLVTPQRGYDNGMILKAHVGSSKDDEYWRQPHMSEEREKMLIEEAISDPELVRKMILVARHNRIIAQTREFHFFTETQFISLIEDIGLTITHTESVYANQCMLITAEKRG